MVGVIFSFLLILMLNTHLLVYQDSFKLSFHWAVFMKFLPSTSRFLLQSAEIEFERILVVIASSISNFSEIVKITQH